MKPRKKSLLLVYAFLGIFFISLSTVAASETFPTKPITMLVTYPPGAVADVTTRSLATATSKFLGTPIVAQTKAGAGGTIAIDFLHNSKPDGYTLTGAFISQLVSGMYTYGVKWSPKDFTMILGCAHLNLAAVIRSDAPWKNFDEWVEYVSKHPGFKYGDYGALGTAHITMEWIAKQYNLKLIPVHYQGDAPGLVALLGGHIQLYVASGSHAPHVRAGKLRTLIQFASDPIEENSKSITHLSDLRGASEVMSLASLPYSVWGPKGIPESIQGKLSEAFKKGMEQPEFIRTMQSMNMRVEYYAPSALFDMAVKDHEIMGKFLTELGLERK